MTRWTDPETGKPMEFPQVVAALLVAEHSRTPAEAAELVTRFPNVVVNGIMGSMNVRATAMALEMAESDAAEGETDAD